MVYVVGEATNFWPSLSRSTHELCFFGVFLLLWAVGMDGTACARACVLRLHVLRLRLNEPLCFRTGATVRVRGADTLLRASAWLRSCGHARTLHEVGARIRVPVPRRCG